MTVATRGGLFPLCMLLCTKGIRIEEAKGGNIVELSALRLRSASCRCKNPSRSSQLDQAAENLCHESGNKK